MTTPRVFIGMPVYNGERFIARAIGSLQDQTLGDFALLVADNASTDGTAAIVRDLAARDRRVRYIRHPRNIGAPRNWNYVLQQADTEYFKWATANDECAPEMLASCVAALDADPGAALCQGRTRLVDEASGAHQEYGADLALMASRPSERLRQLSVALALNNGQCGVIRMSMLQRTRGERLYPGGDIALMAELALLGRFIVLPQVFFNRRMGPTTFSCLLQRSQTAAFYGSHAELGPFSERLRLHINILRAALTLPLPDGERAAAVAVALRRIAWDRGLLWSNLRARLWAR
jgi:glycosyltransferase involved in cell wall biosynthesis